jgi:hypothetical protein
MLFIGMHSLVNKMLNNLSIGSVDPNASSTNAQGQPPNDLHQVKPLAPILSPMLLSEWRGSITTFNGFTGTRPVRELDDVGWDDIKKVIAPAQPAILNEKKNAQYVVPCRLKDAPLVGNTLEEAKSNGQPTTGKMRSKLHVTKANYLVIDIDGLPKAEFNAALQKMRNEGLTFSVYTTHSHGLEDKPGVRARIAAPLDRAVDIDPYRAAWHGFDQQYLNGQAGKADASGANMYQQQGTWCCHPDRSAQAQSWHNLGGVASADALIAIHIDALAAKADQAGIPAAKSAKDFKVPSSARKDTTNLKNEYPPSDANKVADACPQIGTFRDTRGAAQSEPNWFNSLGVVGYCVDGEKQCQEWSSGYAGYDESKTANKLAYRMQMPPTTCEQFKKTNPDGCAGCIQTCRSPITHGWADRDEFEVIESPAISSTESDTSLVAPSKIGTDTSIPLPPPSDAKIIASLASMNPMEYDRVRVEKAKKLGVQVKTLDDKVKKARKADTEVGGLPFPEVEPYPEPIDPAQLFDEVAATIQKFIVLTKEQATAITLWIAMTWLMSTVEVAPLLLITAAEKSCGKSQLLDLLRRIVARPLAVASSSASFLFRAIKSWAPTLLIDEADTFIRDNEELKGLVNAGHTRANAFVGRTVAVGDNHVPMLLPVWAAKAFAGIQVEIHFRDSTMSRGIVIILRRKMPQETVSRLRHADSEVFEVIASKFARFAADYSDQVRHARPQLPDELSDRAQDNWETLLAIAECAGSEWVRLSTTAALALSSASTESASTGNQLLSDIQSMFDRIGKSKISSSEMIVELAADTEASWATYNRGKPLSPRQLAKMLSVYGIQSKTVRLGHANTPKGYDAGQFADAFARYLAPPEILPQRRNVPPASNTGMTGDVADAAQQPRHEFTTLDPLPALDCGGVAAAPEVQPGHTPEDAF